MHTSLFELDLWPHLMIPVQNDQAITLSQPSVTCFSLPCCSTPTLTRMPSETSHSQGVSTILITEYTRTYWASNKKILVSSGLPCLEVLIGGSCAVGGCAMTIPCPVGLCAGCKPCIWTPWAAAWRFWCCLGTPPEPPRSARPCMSPAPPVV